MMERLTVLGVAAGERAAAEARERLAARVADTLPGVATRIESDGVVLSGRGLRARLMREPVLRWIGSLMR